MTTIEEEAGAIVQVAEASKASLRPKRDIIRFSGEKQAAVNLDHVASMFLSGKSITLEFSTKSQTIDCESEESAASVFEALLTTWATGRVE